MTVRRRLWWLVSCLLAWALCVPLVGPLFALAGLVVPAAVFVPFEPLRERRLLRAHRARYGAVGRRRPSLRWRRLVDPERALLVVVTGVLAGGVFWLHHPLTRQPVYWLPPAALALVLLRWTGALTWAPPAPPRAAAPAAPPPPPPAPPSAAAGASSRPELFIAWYGVLGALVYGVTAWFLQYFTVPLVRRTRSFIPELRTLEDFYHSLGGRIADSPFGVAYDRPYWPVLAAGAGLIAGGAAAAARETVARTALAGRVFEELSEAQGQGPPRETTGKVFVSYSRRDAAFARRLHEELAASLREVWVDWLDIEPSAKWRESIDEAIRGSDALIVLLSRDSLRSKYCWLECERALALGKRVLPVVIDPSLDQGAGAALRENGWEPLADYQFLRMTRPEQFTPGVGRIHSFVKSRHRWTAFHTRIGLRAYEWHSGGRSGALLLRGHELAVAEAWRHMAPDDEDGRVALTDEQVAFLRASRSAARRRAGRLRVAAVSVGVALAALAALVVTGESATVAQRREAGSRRLAAAANERAAGDVRQAALLSAAAFTQADTAEARESLVRQLGRFDKVRGVVPAGGAPVSDVSLSVDESVLVIWREDGTAQVWDTVAMRSRGIVSGTRLASVAGGDMSADGRLLGVRRGSVVVLVDTRTAKEVGQADLGSLGLTGVFAWADLSRDGKTLMVKPAGTPGTPDRIGLWDIDSGTLVDQVPGYMLAAGAYGRATVISARDGEPAAMGHLTDPGKAPTPLPAGRLVGVTESGAPVMIDAGTIRVLTPAGRTAWTVGKEMRFEAITHDGRYLAVGRTADRSRYEVWDLRARKRLSTVAAPAVVGGYIPRVSLSDDGRWFTVATSSVSTFQRTAGHTVYSARSGRKEADLPGHAIALGARGRLMAGAGSNGTVTLWDRGPAGRLLTRLDAAGAKPYGFGIASRGDTLAVLDAAGTVRLLRRSDGRLLRTVRPAADAFRVALSPDGALLAVAEARGAGWQRNAQVEVFETANGRRVTVLAGQGIPSPRIVPAALVFSPDGSRLYLGEEHGRSVYTWHTDSWRRGPRFGPDMEVGVVESVAVSPDGAMIAVGGGIQRVQVWDTATGEPLGDRLGRSVAVAFTPDGLLVLGGVGAGNPALVLYDPRARRIVRVAPDSGERTVGVAVAPDGRTLASVTGDRRLQLWDTGLERSITVQGAPIESGDIGFTGAGDRLYALRDGGLSGLVVGPRRWLEALCAITGGPMTADQWQEAAPGERFRQVC
ncbi:toll/interleukin-1 receptor domain-containing protein [Streptomyces venezuelae]|uniref:toll/interleukin-1 receptor domain-containing protein n=1 Tax=Streptomyces venezuelae TaxID=54571 RepID=UPI00362AEF59